MSRYIFIGAILFTQLSVATGTQVQSMQQAQLDSFCPRVEGKTLKECCPPEFATAALKICTYKHIEKAQDTLEDQSVATSCQETGRIPGDETPVYTKCCGAGAVLDCGQEQVDLYYFPRKIFRNGSCGWSECPAGPEYWKHPAPKAPPISFRVGYDYNAQYDKIMNKLKDAPYHKLASTANCQAKPINSCTTSVMCSDLQVASCKSVSCSSYCSDAACRKQYGCETCADLGNCNSGGGGSGNPSPTPVTPSPTPKGGGGGGDGPPGG